MGHKEQLQLKKTQQRRVIESVLTNSRVHFSLGSAIMETLQMTRLPKSSRTTCGPTLSSIFLFPTLKLKMEMTKMTVIWKMRGRLVSQLLFLRKKRKILKRLTKARKRLVGMMISKTQVLAQPLLSKGIREYDL